MQKEPSRSQALLIRSGSVAGWGDRAMSFCCSAAFMYCWNAYILVLSLMPDRRAWWVQSWYQSLNSWLPMYVSCIPLMASCWTLGGDELFLESSLKLGPCSVILWVGC